MIIGVPDKKLAKWLEDKGEHLIATDEGEAVAIAGGWWLGKNERATVFLSADGLCNALNFLTSWIIPDGIEMNLVVSYGRQELPHKVMTDIVQSIIKLLPYDPAKISIEFIS